MSLIAPSSSAEVIFPFDRRPKQSDTFVKLTHRLLRSPEWENLPAVARAVYVDIASLYNGANNGRIGYSARQCADRLHIDKDTANRALRLLEWEDLIRCTQRASFRVKTQTAKAPLWELTQYPLVSIQGPTGLNRETRDPIPGLNRGTLYRTEKNLEQEEGVFRRRRKDPQRERERAEAKATLDRYREMKAAAEANGGGSCA
jgi:hypothetical protein